MAQRKVWAQQEDQILKMLVQVRKINKWSHISKLFSSEFGINHRNGKQCRQRYLNHLASGLKKGQWTEEQQDKLIQLHNRYGNRWAQIARNFDGRTDNCVKNQLYSRLRKSLRFVNDYIQKNLRKRFKLLKINFIYKLIEMADEKYKSIPAIKPQAFQQSYQLKNQILKLQPDSLKLQPDDLKLQSDVYHYEEQKIIALICEINQFNKKYKKRIPRKKTQKDLLSSDGEGDNFSESFSDEVQQKNDLNKKKTLPQTEIQIKIIAPSFEPQITSKLEQGAIIDEESVQDENRLDERSLNSKKFNCLHRLSIEKQSAFQTMAKTIEPEKKIQESINYSLFNRVDPFVHGEVNQNKIKAKRSSSIESIPNIMVDIVNRGDGKDSDSKVSRLRSFGSIEESYEFEHDREYRPSSFERSFMNKEEVDYWLNNVPRYMGSDQ